MTMNRSVCQVICDENVYRIFNANISTSNKLSKSIMLTNESIIIDDKIAQGGFGMVFKAHSVNRQFALKKLCVNNREKLSNCIREIFILKNMHTDFIIHFVDSIIYQTEPDIYEVYILTDYYPGALSNEIKSMHATNHSFAETEVLKIMMNIVEAVSCLHHFHSQPIIHRDLKTENILFGYNKKYILCDFGSATLKEIRPCDVNRQDLQDEISQFTTLSYRSPEMADLYFDGGEHVIGRKSDIWALGVMMYNICFFTLPFGDSVLSILSGQFTIPDNHNYSNNLMKILNYCLTPNPQNRPDISQLSSLIFALGDKPNPVNNYEKSIKINLNDLNLPMKESEAKSVHICRRDKHINKNISNQPIATSIKPRERPKAGGKPSNVTLVKPDPTETNSDNVQNDLLVFDFETSNGGTDTASNDEQTFSKSLDGFCQNKVVKPETDDLMDFESPVNGKIKQLMNTSKSQSLGKQFGHNSQGQQFNVYEMISHSYQNSSHPQQVPFNSNPNSMNPCRMYNPIQFYNPFFPNNMQAFPVHHSNSFNFGMQIGHRRLVSDPSTWYHASPNSNNSANSSTMEILQPLKISVKKTVTNVLDEFDPLTK